MDRGTFVWDDAGTTITLTAEDGSTSLFHVGENVLFHLDRDGNRITGDLADRYQLVKNSTDPRIENRRWVLTEVRGEAVRIAVGGREAFLTLDSEQSRFNGNDSCNAFFGTYELKTGNRITFIEPMGSTMMACPESAVGTSLLKILPQIDNYAIQDDVLSLNKARMAPLARFRLAKDGGPQG
jgi:heat shock protein HslJ